MKPSSEIVLTDGSGCRATGIFEEIISGRMVVSITTRTIAERPLPLCTLCIGIPERDAFEHVLINATALGVCRIIPCKAAYCQKPWWANRWTGLQPRFRQKMITALKQSHNLYLPELADPCDITELIEALSGTTLVADQQGTPLRALPHNSPAGRFNCLIGPPGGFSDAELKLFKEKSFDFVQTAQFRLRTELAATVLCAQLLGHNL
jgi:16S rRNA (uracil1498-N3)-methyltransferase